MHRPRLTNDSGFPLAEKAYAELKKNRGYAYGAAWTTSITDAYQRFPGHYGIQSIEAERLLNVGHFDACRDLVRKIIQAEPNHYDACAVEAMLRLCEGDYVYAQQVLETIRDRDETNYYVALNLPMIYQQLDQTEEADEARRHSLRHYGDNPEVMAAVCGTMSMTEDRPAIDFILERFKDEPSERFLLVKVRLAVRDNDWAKSEALAREAVGRNSESVAGWEHLSLILTQKKEYEEARNAAMYALEINRNAVTALNQLVKISRLEGNNQEAMRFEMLASKISPHIREHQEIRHTIQRLRKREYDRVLNDLRKYLRSSNPTSRKLATNGILRTLNVHPQHVRAGHFIQEIEDLGYRSSLLYGCKATVQMTQEFPDLAFNTLEVAFQEYPNDFNLLYAKLRCLAMAEDLEGMQALGESIYDSGLTAPAQYLLIISVLVTKNLHELSQKFYEQLKQSYPGFSKIGVVEAMLQVSQGKYEEGIERFNQLAKNGEISMPRFGVWNVVNAVGKQVGRKVKSKVIGLVKKRSDKDVEKDVTKDPEQS
jgi:tetratricopeptide (TPR) repeat protein